MNTDHIEALFTRVNDDPELQARFKAVADEAEFDALVSELGYELTYADFTEAASDAELTEEQLADVAGGELIKAAVGAGIALIPAAAEILPGGAAIAGAAAVAKTWNS